MALHRFQRVRRARWIKPATLHKQWTNRVLIRADQPKQDSSHRTGSNARSRSTISESNCDGRVSSRTSRSRPVRSTWLRRNHSRSRRLARLRSTARGRKRLGTTKPSREYFSPLGLTWTETEPARRRRVVARIWAIASPRSLCALRYPSARLKRRGVPALWLAARGLPLARRACACGPETRVCACDGQRTAEKCASWFFPSFKCRITRH